ncbi:zinc-binding dehydrogenase [Halomicroarcula sp. GCM10025710]
MQAVVFPEPDEIEIREVERPEPGPGEALVRVESSTICGSDVKILHGEYGATEYPHIPGHEWSGEIVEVGEDVVRLEPGDRVAAEPHVGCGECARCMEGLYNLCEHYGESDHGHSHIGFTSNGGLAEYVAVDTRALHLLGSMTYDQGAFCEAAGVALHAIERAGIDGGDDVVVIGPGAIGHCAVQIARHGGADNVILTGTREERLAPAIDFGADHTVNVYEVDDVVDHVTELLGGSRPDLVVELAGTETAARQAVEMARRGGDVVLAGSTSPGRSSRSTSERSSSGTRTSSAALPTPSGSASVPCRWSSAEPSRRTRWSPIGSHSRSSQMPSKRSKNGKAARSA